MRGLNIYLAKIPRIEFGKLAIREAESSTFPLVPKDNLRLYDWGLRDSSFLTRFHTPTRIIRKFTNAFQKVWNRIPEKDRCTLNDFWEPISPPDVVGYWSCIACLDDLSTRSFAGSCEMRSGQIWFDIFFINSAKPSAVAHVIAHELGHAISIPDGWMDAAAQLSSSRRMCCL